MTRRDFEKLAIMFKAERPQSNWDANKRLMWDQLVFATAVLCKQENPRFRSDLFLEAAGGLFDPREVIFG